MRPGIDLKALNQYLVVDHFKMETPASLAAAMRQAVWAMSIYLKDAYFHILIAQKSRKYLRLMINGVVYQFRALPFGLATAPLVFTRVMGVVASYAHRRGVRMHMYLDDWLLRAMSQSALREHSALVLMMCFDLGLLVNYPKSNLVPAQDFVSWG